MCQTMDGKSVVTRQEEEEPHIDCEQPEHRLVFRGKRFPLTCLSLSGHK